MTWMCLLSIIGRVEFRLIVVRIKVEVVIKEKLDIGFIRVQGI